MFAEVTRYCGLAEIKSNLAEINQTHRTSLTFGHEACPALHLFATDNPVPFLALALLDGLPVGSTHRAFTGLHQPMASVTQRISELCQITSLSASRQAEKALESKGTWAPM